jgi:hypothetical protein
MRLLFAMRRERASHQNRDTPLAKKKANPARAGFALAALIRC